MNGEVDRDSCVHCSRVDSRSLHCFWSFAEDACDHPNLEALCLWTLVPVVRLCCQRSHYLCDIRLAYIAVPAERGQLR